MEQYGGHLYMPWRWLVDTYHVPESDLKNRTRKTRVEKTGEWVKINHPEKESQKLIRYDTIPKAERRAYSLPTLAEAEALYQQRTTRQATSCRALQVWESLRNSVEANWRPLRAGFTHRTTNATAEVYARLQAALDWCLANIPQPYTRLEVLSSFQDLELCFCPKNPKTAYQLFTRKLSGYAAATDKAAYLLSKRGAKSGNKRALKMGPVQKDWLIKEYGHPMKPTRETLWANYKAFIQANGLDWPELSLRTVGKMLDKNRPAWEMRRNGMAEGRKAIGYLLKKEAPGLPDLLIEFDGTEEPFFYRGIGGKRDGRVYSVRLWDMHSGAIVGSAYGQTETAKLVRAAIQDYLLRQRRQPRQFRYDKGAANVSATVQTLLEATGAASFPSQARRATARRSEQLTRLFQRQFLRDLPGFRGSNYKSDRELDMKPHPDRLAEEWKYETWDSIVARCRQAEEDWNNSPHPANKEGLTRGQLYEQPGSEGRALSLERLAQLLFVKRQRPVRYTTHCLEIQAPDGTRYHFEPQLLDGTVDRALHGQLAGEAVKFDVWEMQDGSRETVLVKRADGSGDWLEMGAKRAWAESLHERAPNEGKELAALLAGEKAYEQQLLATGESEVWRLELGPNGQGKGNWNDAERGAELAAAEQAERTPKLRKQPAPKPAPGGALHPSMYGVGWNSGPAEGPPPSLKPIT